MDPPGSLPGLGPVLDPNTTAAALGPALATLTACLTCNPQKKIHFARTHAAAVLPRLIAAHHHPNARPTDPNTGPTDANSARWTPGHEAVRRVLVLVKILCRTSFAVTAAVLSPGLVAALHRLVDPATTHARLVLDALRALVVVLEPVSFEDRDPTAPEAVPTSVKDALFTPDVLASMSAILAQTTARTVIFEQQRAVLNIVQHCTDPKHRAIVVATGLFDHLASRLACFIHDSDCPIPAESGPIDRHSWPICHSSHLRPLLVALSSVIDSSPYLVVRLMSNPHMRYIFPVGRDGLPTRSSLADHVSSTTVPGKMGWATDYSTHPVDLLVPTSFAVDDAHEFPPYLTVPTRNIRIRPRDRPMPNLISPTAEFGNPLVPWLIYMCRRCDGLDRLAVIGLVARVVAATMSSPALRRNLPIPDSNRELVIASLIPLLVTMTKSALDQLSTAATDQWSRHRASRIVESAPMLIYRLATCGCGTDRIARAAMDADISPLILRLLDYSLVKLSRPDMVDVDAVDDTPPDELHRCHVRASTFYAVVAVVQQSEDYRVSVSKSALRLVPHLTYSIDRDSTDTSSDGPGPNPVSITDLLQARPDNGRPFNHPDFVRIAACDVVKCLARSTKLLKTTLNEFGLVTPLIDLLSDPNLAVRAAATDVCCNLALPYAPARLRFFDIETVKVICHNARQDHPWLCRASLWMLKNLILHTSLDVRKTALDTLIVDRWLVDALSRRTDLSGSSTTSATLVPDRPLPEVGAITSPAPTRPAVRIDSDPAFNPAVAGAIHSFFVRDELLQLLRNFIAEPTKSGGVPMMDEIRDKVGIGPLFDAIAIIIRDSSAVLDDVDGADASHEDDGHGDDDNDDDDGDDEDATTGPFASSKPVPHRAHHHHHTHHSRNRHNPSHQTAPNHRHNRDRRRHQRRSRFYDDGYRTATPLALFQPQKAALSSLLSSFPTSSLGGSLALPDPTSTIQNSVRLLIHIAACGGEYKRKMLDAVLPACLLPSTSSGPSSSVNNGGAVITAPTPSSSSTASSSSSPPSSSASSPPTSTSSSTNIPTSHRLLALVTPLFSHPDPSIRTDCCWLYQNLLWVETVPEVSSSSSTSAGASSSTGNNNNNNNSNTINNASASNSTGVGASTTTNAGGVSTTGGTTVGTTRSASLTTHLSRCVELRSLGWESKIRALADGKGVPDCNQRARDVRTIVDRS